jgi:hypothetical protein
MPRMRSVALGRKTGYPEVTSNRPQSRVFATSIQLFLKTTFFGNFLGLGDEERLHVYQGRTANCIFQIAELLPGNPTDARIASVVAALRIKRSGDSVDESSLLHLFFFNGEKYRERNFLIEMLFDLLKLVCAK